MRVNTSKIMEMKQLIQNIFISFTPGSQEQRNFPRYGFSYLQFCNSQQTQLSIDTNIRELDNPVIFYRIRPGNIYNQSDVDPTIDVPPLNSPSDLISNKILINVSKVNIPVLELEQIDDKYKIQQQYLDNYRNIKPYDINQEFDTNNIYITSVFLTNYRIEKHEGVDILYDYYDNEIIYKEDQLIFGGFNFQSNDRFMRIDLARGFSDIKWEVII